MTKIRLEVNEKSGKGLNYFSSANIYEIFPDSFMKQFTESESFEDFCQAIGCDVTSQEDLDKLQDTNQFDDKICSHSTFESWRDMVQTAYQKLLDRH